MESHLSEANLADAGRPRQLKSCRESEASFVHQGCAKDELSAQQLSAQKIIKSLTDYIKNKGNNPTPANSILTAIKQVQSGEKDKKELADILNAAEKEIKGKSSKLKGIIVKIRQDLQLPASINTQVTKVTNEFAQQAEVINGNDSKKLITPAAHGASKTKQQPQEKKTPETTEKKKENIKKIDR